MEWLLEPFRHEFMQRALFGCALIGFVNGALSAFIVLRRLALMADAIAHSLLPGLALALLLFGLTPLMLFLGALIAALLVAGGSQLISSTSRVKEDTSLGLLFACSFSLGLVLLSFAPPRISVMHYLFGDITGLDDTDLWMMYGIGFLVLVLLVALQRPLLLMMFEPSVARSQGVPVRALGMLLIGLIVLALIPSLRAVGLVLALGMLIAPAASIYLFSDSFGAMFWGGAFIGMAGSCAGLFASYRLDLPSGASIVLMLGLIFLAAYILSPRYGLVAKLLRRRHMHEESLARWDEPAGGPHSYLRARHAFFCKHGERQQCSLLQPGIARHQRGRHSLPEAAPEDAGELPFGSVLERKSILEELDFVNETPLGFVRMYS